MNATLLMDIGGSYTRCRIIEYSGPSHAVPHNIISLSQKIVTRDDLLSFISELLAGYRLQNRLTTAVLCFAGPVTDHSQVTMTNWTGDRDVPLSDLLACGLRADSTTLVNDLEAAAYGLLQCKSVTGNSSEDIIPLHIPDIPDIFPAPGDGNSLLLMPGTGTGIAAILSGPGPGSVERPLVLPCETQHSPIPALDPYHNELIEEVRINLGKTRPTWEDFVSGRGLEMIYRCLVKLDGRDPGLHDQTNTLDAAAIAELAVSGTDELCHAALGTYYRCAGALAQVLALTFRPFNGIYLAGNSTRNNISYIPDSAFVSALHDNDIHRTMLETFPVYMVQTDLNLDGAGYLAERSMHGASRTSLIA